MSLQKAYIATMLLISVSMVYADTESEAEIFENITRIQEEFEQKKSQSGTFVNHLNEKQAVQTQMKQLEEAARELQETYLHQLSQLEREFAETKLSLERDYLTSLQNIYKQIQDLLNHSKGE